MEKPARAGRLVRREAIEVREHGAGGALGKQIRQRLIPGDWLGAVRPKASFVNDTRCRQSRQNGSLRVANCAMTPCVNATTSKGTEPDGCHASRDDHLPGQPP